MKVALATVAAIAAIAIVCALAAFLFRVEPERYLVLGDGKGGKLGELRLPDGGFDHVFIHSIHLTPVEERFRVEADGLFKSRLRLFELRYESCGVGMPSDAEGGFRLEDGKFILTMDRSFGKIPIRASIVPGHGVVAGGAFHPFAEWVPPEGLVELSGVTRYVLKLRR